MSEQPEEKKSEPIKLKGSFVSEGDLKSEGKEEKKEVLKIPPAEISLMYCCKELREISINITKLLALFEGARAQINTIQKSEAPSAVKTGIPTPEPKPVETKTPEVSARLAEVKLKLGEFTNMLNFDEQASAQYIKVSPKQFLGAENFAKIATLIRTEFGGQYVSQGKHSHFLVPKQKSSQSM